MHRLPPLRELQAFESAARLLSFRKAAEELSVTPTAVSHQIRLLERYCGQSLFQRQPRPLQLTTAGAQLLPVVRDAFLSISDELARLTPGNPIGHLRVTATSAFAARWLLPRLESWRAEAPGSTLELVGTDTVLNLRTGEVDVAIRYARQSPTDGVAVELLRDTFHVVAAPSILQQGVRMIEPQAILDLPRVEVGWPLTDVGAPTWRHWETAARAAGHRISGIVRPPQLKFHEEHHGIEAIVAGQGLGLCSDVLVARELRDGRLLRVSDIVLPGYGFYFVYRAGHPRRGALEALLRWMQRQASA
ncbi:MAG: LysR family transcriptional regulator [Mesorhizobium sp.]|uniref:LysR substrate-binding domain-containing protein n=1 Tax=Mesorhizobium sp. TaxID=1871066 RepID=UPI001207D4EC|nr:LysR substrate-binding domain-containing protein [Mesorhizobium sp.]TIR14972.1 MAG: LysR family transcriptional regulator [Mesorhizobium sp.]